MEDTRWSSGQKNQNDLDLSPTLDPEDRSLNLAAAGSPDFCKRRWKADTQFDLSTSRVELYTHFIVNYLKN